METEKLNITYKSSGVNYNKKHPCGCVIEIPHSHLVIGYECPCEKGIPEETLTE